MSVQKFIVVKMNCFRSTKVLKPLHNSIICFVFLKIKKGVEHTTPFNSDSYVSEVLLLQMTLQIQPCGLKSYPQLFCC